MITASLLKAMTDREKRMEKRNQNKLERSLLEDFQRELQLQNMTNSMFIPNKSYMKYIDKNSFNLINSKNTPSPFYYGLTNLNFVNNMGLRSYDDCELWYNPTGDPSKGIWYIGSLGNDQRINAQNIIPKSIFYIVKIKRNNSHIINKKDILKEIKI